MIRHALRCLIVTLAFTVGLGADEYKILEIKNSPPSTWPDDMPKKQTTSIYQSGKSLEKLRDNAIRAYAYFWRMQASYPVSGLKGKALIKSLIAQLPSRLKIQNISDKIAIVEVPWHRAESLAEKSSVNDISLSGDVWLLENETWVPIFGEYIPYRKVQRIDLNGDGFEDLVVKGGCCDTISMNIFINKGNESVLYSQNISIIGNLDLKLTGNCSAEISVSHFQDDASKKKAIFDCSTNRFQP